MPKTMLFLGPYICVNASPEDSVHEQAVFTNSEHTNKMNIHKAPETPGRNRKEVMAKKRLAN